MKNEKEKEKECPKCRGKMLITAKEFRNMKTEDEENEVEWWCESCETTLPFEDVD